MSEEKPSVDEYFDLVGREAKLFHAIQVLKKNNDDLRTRLAQSVDEQIPLDRVNELKDKYYALCELVIKAILEFQWVTNGIKLNENQHIRLGDTICALHDAVAEYEQMKSADYDIEGSRDV